MNWDTVAAVLEIASGIAVFISLMYLALQIRFARLAAADTSRTARAIGVRENVLAMANNSELRENWIKSSSLESVYEVLGGELKVSANGAIQIDHMCQSWMWLHWGQFSSTTTDDDLEELARLIGVFYSNPPMSICWNESPFDKGLVEDKFVEFVNEAVKSQQKKPVAVDS